MFKAPLKKDLSLYLYLDAKNKKENLFKVSVNFTPYIPYPTLGKNPVLKIDLSPLDLVDGFFHIKVQSTSAVKINQILLQKP